MTPDREVRERAFEALYTAHYREIAGYVLRRVPAHAADDVIAQVFAVAWRRFDDVPAPPVDRLWLLRVARNSVADQRRSEHRRLHLFVRLSPMSRSRWRDGRDRAWQRSWRCRAAATC